jgi:hypothetical protein
MPGRFHAYDGNFRARPEISHAYHSPGALTPTGRSFAPRPSMTEPRTIEPRTMEPRSIFPGNNLYSDRGGNVYRFNPARNGWERNSGSEWRSAPAFRAPELNRYAYGRSLGQQRFGIERSAGGGFGKRQKF